MTKPDSLYNQGMKLLLHSKIASQRRNIEWYRGGRFISYYKNKIQRKGFTFYTLTFTIDSKYNNDEIYIAADYPYTYSFLLQQIRGWCCQRNKPKARSTILCKTSAGNDFPIKKNNLVKNLLQVNVSLPQTQSINQDVIG